MHKQSPRPRALWPMLAAMLSILGLPGRAAADVPADGWVVWTSNRDQGRDETFRCRADGSEVTQLTKTGSTYPLWSPDGRFIAYHDMANLTHLMRPDGSNDRLIGGLHLFWMHDNAGLVLAEGNDVSILDPDTGDKTPFFQVGEFAEFQNTLTNFYALTHDRRYMMIGSGIYDYGYSGANGFFKQPYSISLVDMLDKHKIYMVHLGCWGFTPPAGNFVYHIRGDGDTWPDIYRLNLADLATLSSYEPEVAFPDADWGHEYHPQVSNDNQWLVYMTSQGCHWDYTCNNEIFIHRLGSGSTSRTQVTHDESFDAFPSIYIGKPWAATDPARLVLSPNKLTFFARNGAVPVPRTVLAKSSADNAPAVAAVTATPQASWLDATVAGNKITIGLRAGQIWRGRCGATVSVAVPGLVGSPAEIQVVVDADESFPEPPPPVAYDGGSIDADSAGGGNAEAGARDVPAPCDLAIAGIDSGPTTPPITSPPKSSDSGCSCAMGGSVAPLGPVLLIALGLLLARTRRPRRR